MERRITDAVRYRVDAGPASTSRRFAWVVLLGFIRLTTKRGLFPSPLTQLQATGVVEHWLGRPAAAGTAANLVTGAHLAALALEHGAEVVSFDSDFGRFSGVRWHSPADDR